MIKQIKYRDFRNDLTKLKFFECDVFDGEGVLVGQWKPANNGLPMHVAQPFEKLCTSEPNRLDKSEKIAELRGLIEQVNAKHALKASGNSEIMASDSVSHSVSGGCAQELIKCELCQKEKEEVYEIWEEGEEKKVCRDCIASRVPPKMLSGVLKRSKRVSE